MKSTGQNKRGKTCENPVIAFISARVGSIFMSTVARGVDARACELGWKKNSIIYTSPRSMNPEDILDEVDSVMRNNRMHGIIMASMSLPETHIKKILKRKIPVVLIEREAKGLCSVTVDNYAGGFLAGEYLAGQGYKKPGIISDMQADDVNSASHKRLCGFLDALKKYSIKPDPALVGRVKVHTIENGRECADKYENKMKKIDSIFSVAGDMAAIGFMIEAKSHGVRVPEDIAIIGFDDVEMADAVTPALTTISQPIEGMGREAVSILNNLINEKSVKICGRILEAKLIKRDSA